MGGLAMDDVTHTRAPAWFRLVSLLALLWNLFGVWQYLGHVGAVPMMQAPNAEEAAIAAGAPAWVTAAFAIGVFGGALGALGLILAKSWTRSLFILSLVAAAVQFSWWCFLSGAAESIGPSIYALPAVIIATALLLVWLAGTGIKRGWLN
jgi:hypothetical protein